MLIFDLSKPGYKSKPHCVANLDKPNTIPADLYRDDAPSLPAVAELDVVRHYTLLSNKNFSIEAGFYPLGS